MSNLSDTDLLLVQRDDQLFYITPNQMSTLNDTDLLLVERFGVQYKLEAQYLNATSGEGSDVYDINYLVIGGGGLSSSSYNGSIGGGGAGGFITSIDGEQNPSDPGTVDAPGALKVPVTSSGLTASITVGAATSASTFAGPGWHFTAFGGGSANNSIDGASGAGGLVNSGPTNPPTPGSPGGAGSLGQGFNGAQGGAGDEACYQEQYWCHAQCTNSIVGGGGGGAGGAASGYTPGPGLPSSITGSSVFYAAGGAGSSICPGNPGPLANGANNYGSGAGAGSTAQDGVVMLRYSTDLEITFDPGHTVTTTIVNGSKLSVVTGGTGNISIGLPETPFTVSKGAISPTGLIQPGTELTGSATVEGGVGTVTIQHEWEANGVVDVTATESTFTPTEAGGVRYRQVATDDETVKAGEWSDSTYVSTPPDGNLEFVLIGGGGSSTGGTGSNQSRAGGGAGGYISSVVGELSGGGTPYVDPVTVKAGETYYCVVGAAGSDSSLSGPVGDLRFTFTAVAGGASGQDGGSGGGQYDPSNQGPGVRGLGTAGQGFDGGYASGNFAECFRDSYGCHSGCVGTHNGAGSGAGSPANGSTGGNGVQSSITGTPVWYAGGGAAKVSCSGPLGTAGLGRNNYGGGGQDLGTGNDGVLILRYPQELTFGNPLGGLTFSTATVGDKKVTTITGGSGNFEFT